MTSVEGLIFWLVPVILLVVFTLIVANHARDPRRRKLLLVEPVGTLIPRWRAVRMIGDVNQLRQALAWIEQSRLGDDAPLDCIISLDQPTNPSEPAPLLGRETLGAWSEQRVLQRTGRTISILAGEVEKILAGCRYRSDGRILLTDSDRAEYILTANRAGEHGYLAVAFGARYFHSRVYDPDKHTWLGLILFEPVYDQSLMNQLEQVDPSRLKLLSLLPDEFLQSIITKLRGTSQFAGIPRRPVDTPLEEEQQWQTSSVIGSADLAKRHAVIRYFEPRRDCRMLSTLAADHQLPIPVRRVL